MGNKISISDNNNFKTIDTSTQSGQTLYNTLYESIITSSFEDINQYNLKRACCARLNGNTYAYVSVPIENLITEISNDYKYSTITNDIKQYSTIRFLVSNLTDEVCTLTDKSSSKASVYKPYNTSNIKNSSEQGSSQIIKISEQNTSVCDGFMNKFCGLIYDQRLKKYGDTITASYFTQQDAPSLSEIEIYNSNWFSDCNCINSILVKKPPGLTILNNSSDFMYSNIRDSMCGNRSLFPTTPYWSYYDYYAFYNPPAVCSNTIMVNNDVANNISLSGLNMNNFCGNSAEIKETIEKYMDSLNVIKQSMSDINTKENKKSIIYGFILAIVIILIFVLITVINIFLGKKKIKKI